MTEREHLENARREYWKELLPAVNWNVADAALHAGVNRTHAYQIIDQLGVRRPTARRVNCGSWAQLGL